MKIQENDCHLKTAGGMLFALGYGRRVALNSHSFVQIRVFEVDFLFLCFAGLDAGVDTPTLMKKRMQPTR